MRPVSFHTDTLVNNSSEAHSLAAIDLGSNSFHMIVGRLKNGQLQLIDRLREPVRLAAGLTDDHRLKPEVAQRALDCLKRFGQRISGLQPDNVRAVGTNTLRLAQSRNGFLDQAQDALGHSIEVISGIEEARLVHLGVAHSLAEPGGRRLVVDAAQGVEAQSVANCYTAVELGLEVIPVLNKIDLPAADPDRVCKEIEEVIGIEATNALRVSAKTGEGIHELLEQIVADGGDVSKFVGKAKDNGVLWFGTQASQTSLAPEIVVANLIYDWSPMLTEIIEQRAQGVYGGKAYVINLENKGQVMEYNPDFDLPADVKQLAEATLQLRGDAGEAQIDGARLAMTQNIGGSGATIATHILRRPA